MSTNPCTVLLLISLLKAGFCPHLTLLLPFLTRENRVTLTQFPQKVVLVNTCYWRVWDDTGTSSVFATGDGKRDVFLHYSLHHPTNLDTPPTPLTSCDVAKEPIFPGEPLLLCCPRLWSPGELEVSVLCWALKEGLWASDDSAVRVFWSHVKQVSATTTRA